MLYEKKNSYAINERLNNIGSFLEVSRRKGRFLHPEVNPYLGNYKENNGYFVKTELSE